MPKYLDSAGVSYLWSKIKRIQQNKIVYYSNSKQVWNLEPQLISEKDVLYIYTDYKTVNIDDEQITIPGLKIGDGKSYLIDLPFFNDISNFNDIFMDHINNKVIHVSMEDRMFWDNKLNLFLREQEQNLILNRE